MATVTVIVFLQSITCLTIETCFDLNLGWQLIHTPFMPSNVSYIENHTSPSSTHRNPLEIVKRADERWTIVIMVKIIFV